MSCCFSHSCASMSTVVAHSYKRQANKEIWEIIFGKNTTDAGPK